MSEEKKIATSGFVQHVPDSTVVEPEHIVNVIKNGLLHECLGEEWRKAAVSTIENLVANGSAKAMSKEEVQELTDSINRAEAAIINPQMRDEILRPKRDIIIERPNGEIPGLLDVNVTLCHLFGIVIALVLDEGKLKGMELRRAYFEGEEIIVTDKKLCRCPAGAHVGYLEAPVYCMNCGAHCLADDYHRHEHFRGY